MVTTAINSRRKVTLVDTSTVSKMIPPVIPPAPIPSTVWPSISVIAAHAVIAGQPIYVTPVGTMEQAGTSIGPSIGVVITNADAGAMSAYIPEGSVSRGDWSPITGFNDLIPGLNYFLADQGKLTHVTPTTGLLQKVGMAVSRSMLDVKIQAAIQLA